MRVLVTGGLGQIGSHITELLLQKNYEVLVLDNLTTGRKEHLNKLQNLRIFLGSISDKD